MSAQLLGGLLFIPVLFFAYLAYKKFMEMRAHAKLSKENPKLANDEDYKIKSSKLLQRFNLMGILTLLMYIAAFRMYTAPTINAFFSGW